MDEKKRILYVITKANWGGAQRYVFDLAVAAQAAGHDVAVAYGEEGVLSDELTKVGIPHTRLEALARDFDLKKEYLSFKELRSLLNISQPDIIHVNSSKGGLALLAARSVGVKRIIFTAHGWAFNERRPWWQKPLIKLAYAVMVYLSHTTICVSEAVYRDMHWLPLTGKKLMTVRLGISPTEPKDKKTSRERLAPSLKDTTWLGVLAELHPSKGIDTAIKALAEVRRFNEKVGLVVIGEGSDREYLESLIAHYELKDHVVLAGFVADAAQYLPAFDIFLMPSRTEALSYALLEAGAVGLPSIGSRVGGIPEILIHKRTGLLVAPSHSHVLASSVLQLLNDQAQAKELGENLKNRVAKEFTRERMLTETLALY